MNVYGSNSTSVMPQKVYAERPMGSITARQAPPVVSPSRWDTNDTVELTATEPPEKSVVTLPSPEDRISGASYTKEDLAPLKERFAAMQKMENGIKSKLKSILSANRLEVGIMDQIKIEIDSGGRAIVGGMKDSRLARELTKAINADKDFVQSIKEFQKEEANLSSDLNAVTGMSLRGYKDRIRDIQTADPKQIGGGQFGLTRDDYVNLKDQDLYCVDAEFAEMIGKHYGQYDYSTDFSGTNKVLEHAETTVNKTVQNIIWDIGATFEEHNRQLRASITDPEELKEQLLSLKSVTITVDNEGNLSIEGQTARDPRADRGGKAIIEDMFDGIADGNMETGQKNDFVLAMDYLLTLYDEGFGGDDPGRKMNTVFKNGQVETHVTSPEKERELRDEIAGEARSALSDMGIAAESLEIDVDDDGKLVVLNMPESEIERKGIEQALDVLNKMTATRTQKDFDTMHSRPVNSVERLKGLMSHLDVFLPGGAGKLSDIRLDELDSVVFTNPLSSPKPASM